jgi:hypothetical protein
MNGSLIFMVSFGCVQAIVADKQFGHDFQTTSNFKFI